MANDKIVEIYQQRVQEKEKDRQLERQIHEQRVMILSAAVHELGSRMGTVLKVLDDALDPSQDIKIRLQAAEMVMSRFTPKVRSREATLEESELQQPMDVTRIRDEVVAMVKDAKIRVEPENSSR